MDEKSREHMIIAGCGNIGSKIALELSGQGKDVLIIDICSSSFINLKGNKIVGRVRADAMDTDILKQCGIKDADVFLALTGNDNTNIFISEMARRIFNVPKVIAGIRDCGKKRLILDEYGILHIDTGQLIIKEIKEILDAE